MRHMKKVPQARQETPSSQPKREAPKVRSEAGLRQTLRQLHKLVFEAIDAAERRPTVDALDRLEYVMSVQLDAEAETIHTMGSAEGGDAQAVLRFSLRRMCERGAPIDARRARLRVVRDLFVAHSEREELIRNLGEASRQWLRLQDSMSEVERGIGSLHFLIDPENN